MPFVIQFILCVIFLYMEHFIKDINENNQNSTSQGNEYLQNRVDCTFRVFIYAQEFIEGNFF